MEEALVRVYHASEVADIDEFVPKRYWHIGFERSGPLVEGLPDGAEAIECFYGSSEWYVPFYYAPKSCPRLLVCRTKSPSSFHRLGEVVRPLGSDRVMFFRCADRELLERHRFTVYELPGESFERLPNGEFVAHRPVKPICRRSMADVVASLEAQGYQVAFVSDVEATRVRLLGLGLTVDSEGVPVAGWAQPGAVEERESA